MHSRSGPDARRPRRPFVTPCIITCRAPSIRNLLSSQAHEFFKEQVDHWLKELPGKIEERAEALERTITNLLEMVVIDLKTEDDPHVIFETLKRPWKRLYSNPI